MSSCCTIPPPGPILFQRSKSLNSRLAKKSQIFCAKHQKHDSQRNVKLLSTQRRKKAHFCLNCFKTSFSYPDNLKLQQKKNETFVSSCILSQPGYELVLSLIWDIQTPKAKLRTSSYLSKICPQKGFKLLNLVLFDTLTTLFSPSYDQTFIDQGRPRTSFLD